MEGDRREIAEFGANDDFWLFGYGSLLWKPPPEYDRRVPGYIEGYVRRFWQACSDVSFGAKQVVVREQTMLTIPSSEDHRGTPEAPGRVATLISHDYWQTLADHHGSTCRVWGAAYHIPAEHVSSVREKLDIRETNGYSIEFTSFHISNPSDQPDTASAASGPHTLRCLVYVGHPSNPQYLGPQDPDALARKIMKSKGPSGENKEYLLKLEQALAELTDEGPDEHVIDLARRCKALEDQERG